MYKGQLSWYLADETNFYLEFISSVVFVKMWYCKAICKKDLQQRGNRDIDEAVARENSFIMRRLHGSAARN